MMGELHLGVSWGKPVIMLSEFFINAFFFLYFLVNILYLRRLILKFIFCSKIKTGKKKCFYVR